MDHFEAAQNFLVNRYPARFSQVDMIKNANGSVSRFFRPQAAR